MDILDIIISNNLSHLLNESVYGIEKECIRITSPDCRLARTKHPILQSEHPAKSYIQTDYSESQPEIITPPLAPLNESLRFLLLANSYLYQALPQDELLWVNSMPAILPADHHDIPISLSSGPQEYRYREYTGDKYGRDRQLISGIHINFSLSEELLIKLFKQQSKYDNIQKMKNDLYLKIARSYLAKSWLLQYYYGASPVSLKFKNTFNNPIRSIRNSSHGYKNKSKFKVSYLSLEDYIKDINHALKQGHIYTQREYSSSVRLRTPQSKNINDLLKYGINYLEFRSTDLNPYSPIGITDHQAKFYHLFYIYLLLGPNSTMEDVELGINKINHVSEESPATITKFQDDGLIILDQMDELFYKLNFSDAHKIIDQHRLILKHPEYTVSAAIMNEVSDKRSFLSFHHNLATSYRNRAKASVIPYWYKHA